MGRKDGIGTEYLHADEVIALQRQVLKADAGRLDTQSRELEVLGELIVSLTSPPPDMHLTVMGLSAIVPEFPPSSHLSLLFVVLGPFGGIQMRPGRVLRWCRLCPDSRDSSRRCEEE